jgi:hypothetical protein
MATQRPGFTRNDTDAENKGIGLRSLRTDNDPENTDAKPPDLIYVSESPQFDASKEDHFGQANVISDAKDLLTHVIHVDDDPSLSPWTFRAFFLGKTILNFASTV